MLTRSIRVSVLVAPTLMLAACATTTPATYGLDNHQAALVRQTCSEVMGLSAGYIEYNACGDSLAQTVRALGDTERTANAHRQCDQQGLTSADLAKCVVTTRRAGAEPAVQEATLIAVSQPQRANSYLRVSRDEQGQRKELSCAHIGLHPASRSFDHCVTDLGRAIADARNLDRS